MVSQGKAIAQSCDVDFCKSAQILGIDEIYFYLSKFGFGIFTGVDFDDELTGILPSKEWKLYQRNEPWYPADTILMGIGQGTTTVTGCSTESQVELTGNPLLCRSRRTHPKKQSAEP